MYVLDAFWYVLDVFLYALDVLYTLDVFVLYFIRREKNLQKHALNYPWLCYGIPMAWHGIVQYIQVISTSKGVGFNCTYIGESQPSNDYMAACNTNL